MTFIQRYFTAFFAKVNQLDRIESDLASKASSLALTATRAELGATRRDLKTLQGDVLVFQDGNNVAISLINERLSDRPTRGDLTIVASDLGARLELVETYQAALEASAEATRASIRSTISNAVASVEAHKTGEPSLAEALAANLQAYVSEPVEISANLDPTETVAFIEDLRVKVMTGDLTPNQARAEIGKAPLPKVTAKARKLRAPKAGGE